MNKPIISFSITSILFIGILFVELVIIPVDSRESRKATSPPQVIGPSEQPQCKDMGDFWKDKLPCQMKESALLSQIQNFAIVFGAILFVLEGKERRERAKREAWSTVDAAQNQETSGARIQALEELANNKHTLAGLDADGADLIGISLPETELFCANLNKSKLNISNLEGANLSRSSMVFADLRGAQLSKANLQDANLSLAKLSTVDVRTWQSYSKISKKRSIKDVIFNIARFKSSSEGQEKHNNSSYDDSQKTCLRSAKLWGAKLLDADLRGVNLRDADLSGADLRYADLTRADLSGADLTKADLRYTNLEKIEVSEATNFHGTKLWFAKNLNQRKLESAKNFKFASLEKTSPTAPSDNQASNNGSKAEKIENYILRKIEEFKRESSGEASSYNQTKLSKLADELLQSLRTWSMLEFDEENEQVKSLLYTLEEDTEALKEANANRAARWEQARRDRHDFVVTGNWLSARAETFGQDLSNYFNISDKCKDIVSCLHVIANSIKDLRDIQKHEIQGAWTAPDCWIDILEYLKSEYLPPLFDADNTEQAIRIYLDGAIQESIESLQQASNQE